ncbi:MAG: YlbF family regulator [Anaerolineales bacterium]|nr:YlbF family regulator [Anaerolineales bacterium]MDW8161877.1 YlbF family regulator [Anaerolineales bacterium]
MELPSEIKAAALELVKAMKQDSTIRLYLSAKEAVENDPEASALESRLLELYEDLIQRQSRGEELSEEHIRAFNALRYQVRFHPLIARRENALAQIKPYLAQIAEEISDSLGIDYTILADAQCRGCS